jgi:hypothetical protein
MALPISVTYTFATATSAIPLSQLDANFTTVVNGINGIGNGTNALTNATINGFTGDTSVINVGSGQFYKGTSGNVGIGTSSPNGKLQVTGGTTNASNLATSYSAAAFTLVPKSTSGFSLAFGSGPSDFPYIQMSAAGAVASDMSLQPYGGNVGIGTDSPGGTLDVNGTITSRCPAGGTGLLMRGRSSDNLSQVLGYDNGVTTLYGQLQFGSVGGGITTLISNGATGYTNFFTNGSERARITTGGALLIGLTSPLSSELLSVSSGGAYVGVFQQSTNTSGYHVLRCGLQQNGNNTSSYFFWGNTNNVGNWYLYGNGTTSFSSDQRLKKNIETTRDGYLEDISKLRVVKYNWRNDEAGKPKELGLIAQEVEQVFPGLVQDDLEKISADDDTTYKSLKHSVLPFILLKAIQELKAQNDELKARVAALETK